MVQARTTENSLIFVTLYLVILGLLTSCSDAVPTVAALRDNFAQPKISIAAVKTKLKVQQSTQFNVTGGVEPYSFSILEEGQGTIDGSGLYTAPGNTSKGKKATIKAIDSLGRFSQTEILLYDELAVTASALKMAVNNVSTLQVSGGVPPYSYTLPENSGLVDGSGNYTAPASAGTYEVQVSDSEGNSANVSLFVAEVLQISSLPTANVYFSQSVSFSAAGGVPPYSYSLIYGGGQVNSSTGQYIAQAPSGSAKVRVTDALDNISEVGFTIQPAVVTVTSPTAGGYIKASNSTAFAISGACSDNGFPVTLSAGSVAATPVSCVNGAYSHSFNTTSIPDGDVLVEVGQEGASPVTLNLKKDTQVPIVSLSSPNQTNAFSSMMPISGQCSENQANVVIIIKVSDGNDYISQTSCISGSFSVTASLSSIPEGNFKLIAGMSDLAGNFGMSDTIELAKDTIAPSVPTSITLSSSVSLTTETPLIQWATSTDATSGVSHYEVDIYIDNNKVTTSTATTNKIKIQGLSLEDNTQYKVKIRAVDKAGNTSTSSTFSQLWKAKSNPCPGNYILVPSQAGSATSDFCVAKYEMKVGLFLTAISSPLGNPWLLARDSNATNSIVGARYACMANGSNYDLISNVEWKAIARNIASVAGNWSTGVVYSGFLNRGHAFNNPAMPLAAVSDDSQGCSGVTAPCANNQWNAANRTHKLSNGTVIWDFSGNVWEWVLDATGETVSAGPVSTFPVDSVMQKDYGADKLCGSPEEAPFCGYGNFLIQPGTIMNDAIARGGSYNMDTVSGVFAAIFGVDPMSSNPGFGFRCVYNPNTAN